MNVYVNELDETESLRDLPCGKFLRVMVPKSPAAYIVAAVTDSIISEADVRIADRVL